MTREPPGGAAPSLGFASSTLAATGAPLPGGIVDAPVGSSLAFDFDSNLWAAGATVGDPTLQRFPASALGAGTGTPDLALMVPAIGCVPAIKGIALDAKGDLWLSTCKDVLRIASSELTPRAEITAFGVEPRVTLSGLASNEDVAFDSSGNLWVAGDGNVLRFDKARLAHDDAAGPNLTLSVTTDDVTPKALAANFLAFDKAGNLWALDFAANTVFEIPKRFWLGRVRVWQSRPSTSRSTSKPCSLAQHSTTLARSGYRYPRAPLVSSPRRCSR